MNKYSKVILFAPSGDIILESGKNLLVEEPYEITIFEACTREGERFIQVFKNNVPFVEYHGLPYALFY